MRMKVQDEEAGKIYSPDQNYSVVVEEWTWLFAGSVILYERTNPFLVEKMAVLTTDWERPGDTAVVALRKRE